MSQEIESDATDNTTQQKAAEKKTFEDLTENQKAVIVELAREQRENLDRSNSEIAEEAGVDSSYPQKVREKYGYLVDELLNQDELPDLETEEEPTADTGGDMDIEDAIELARLGVGNDGEKYRSLTETEQAIVDEVAERPAADNSTIADLVEGADSKSVSQVREEYEDVIEVRRRAIILRPIVNGSIDPDVAKAFHDLTEKQQSVVVELAKEPDPEDPEQPGKKIGTYAGTHPTYVGTVREKYAHIADELRDATAVYQDAGESEREEPEVEEVEVAEEPETVEAEETEEVETEEEDEWEKKANEVETGEATETVVSSEPTQEARERTDEATGVEESEGPTVEEVLADVETLREQVEMTRDVADSELDASADGNSTSAVARKSVADAVVDELDSILSEYDTETTD